MKYEKGRKKPKTIISDKNSTNHSMWISARKHYIMHIIKCSNITFVNAKHEHGKKLPFCGRVEVHFVILDLQMDEIFTPVFWCLFFHYYYFVSVSSSYSSSSLFFLQLWWSNEQWTLKRFSPCISSAQLHPFSFASFLFSFIK